jgi:hypothetical protein
VQRLKLLRHALDEMRIQLGQLSPGDRAARPLETFRPRLVT